MIDRERFREGSHEYFTEIIREYGCVVKGLCLSFGETEDDVDDLVQQAWSLVFRRRHSYKGNGAFAGWLYRVTLNNCTDVFRSMQAERKNLEGFLAKGGTDGIHRKPGTPEDDLRRREAERTIWPALNNLPEKERDAIILRLLQGCSPGEVAGRMGIEKASVRSNICRGLRRLRGLIGGGEE